LRTLIADGDTLVRHTLARQFALLDLGAAETCNDAGEAMAKVRGDPRHFDVLLWDLNMPGVDGLELVRRLTELRYTGHLLLVSGASRWRLDAAIHLARCHGLRVLGGLRKPVSPQQLRTLYARVRPTQRCGGSARSHDDADRLRAAIAAGEFCNHYQPKVMFDSGRVIGVEALARWQHPDDGLVPPDEFIPLAEAEDLIDPLTRTLLQRQLRDLHDWRTDGIDLSLAFNASVENFIAPDLPEFIATAAAAMHLEHARLVVELTESRLSNDLGSMLDTLGRLRLGHVELAIDNFGAGDATIESLRDIPIDELKIDRSFVHGAWRDPTLRAVVESSLRLARKLGIRTVAEGVEDRQDWDLLRALGCDVAQGFFISEPLPAQALPAWLGDWAWGARELVRPTHALA
jgi:EAL domain-containing protein (putative c-di-GMP-specific phosphodiesterase class I)/FixJ family two-component response regulator